MGGVFFWWVLFVCLDVLGVFVVDGVGFVGGCIGDLQCWYGLFVVLLCFVGYLDVVVGLFCIVGWWYVVVLVLLGCELGGIG